VAPLWGCGDITVMAESLSSSLCWRRMSDRRRSTVGGIFVSGFLSVLIASDRESKSLRLTQRSAPTASGLTATSLQGALESASATATRELRTARSLWMAASSLVSWM
jgi:hypothetical protein